MSGKQKHRSKLQKNKEEKIQRDGSNRIWKFAAGIALMTGGCIAPPFPGLSRPGMQYLGILACMIFYLVVDLCDEYLIVLFALSACLLMRLESFTSVFGAFSNTTVWLLIGVLPLSVIIEKSGLMKRIALYVLKCFPNTYPGQLLAFTAAGLLISPLIPSITAKAGMLAPFAVNAAREMNLKDKSKGLTGLFMTVFLFGSICGHVFYSGSMNVFILLGFLPENMQNAFTWGSWLKLTFIWGLCILILGFPAMIWLYRPEDAGRTSPDFIDNKLRELGRMSTLEIKVTVVLTITLLFWITKGIHGISEPVVALTAFFVLALMGTIHKKEFRGKVAWDMVMFIGGLMCMAAIMTDMGVDLWLADVLSPYIRPMLVNEYVFIFTLSVLVALSRYVIVSSISAASLFYIVFSGPAQSLGISPWVTAFVIITIGQSWSTRFNNTSYLTAVAVMDDGVLDFREVVKMSHVYVVISIIGFLLSIPLWKHLGMIV